MVSDENIMKRLAFIKYLYDSAVKESHKSEPYCSASILIFHCAAELFFELATEYKNIDVPSYTNFMQYWNLLTPKVPSGITQKASMNRFNKARVALKHHGNLPHPTDIEAFRATLTNFFEENTEKVFELKFSEISIIELVDYKDVKESLEKAIKFLNENKLKEARDNIAIAFAQLINNFKTKHRERFYPSPFFFDNRIEGYDYWLYKKTTSEFDEKMLDFIRKTGETIKNLKDALEILCLNIDYHKYILFKLLTPYIYQTADDKYHVHEFSRLLMKKDVKFCLDFVIECAINLQRFDSIIKKSD